MEALQNLYNQINFFFSTLTWFGLLDLLLVTLTFYFLLSAIRRSSAGYLLREVLAFALALFVLTTLLPLPVFDWLVRAALVATLVAIPIIFQVQLRHFIERAGRVIGISQVARQSAAEIAVPEILYAVENMAATKTGALIALEANDSLKEVIQTGVPFNGQVTSALLQSIFYSGTPLHDGAVVIRTDKVVAAGCVLPLTQQTLESEKRLGTRHRAAVGLSENSDALVIVVSEETGYIAAARHGQLKRPLHIAQLREKLLDFFEPSPETAPSFSAIRLLGQAGRQLWSMVSLTEPRQLFSRLGLFAVSVMLALVVWSFVIEQTNPIRSVRIENIPLRVENVPPDSRLIPSPPSTVAAVVQTTEEILPTLTSRSFQGTASLSADAPGLYRLPVRVNSGATQVLVLSVDPPALDVQLAPIISLTMPVQINIPPDQGPAAAYELVGSPTTVPEMVTVTGPAPLIEQVDQLQTTLALANATASLRESRPVRALDDQGAEIMGLTFQPSQVQVNATIRRRSNTREVGVRAMIEGPPPSGYWLSDLRVAPAGVIVQGQFEQLAELGGIVNTAPVDISEVRGDLSAQVPLDLPPEVWAFDTSGNPVQAVTVSVRVTPRSGDMTLSQPVELLSASSNLSYTLDPPEVDLLLSGPVPTLREIETNPDLIRVLLEPGAVRRGQSVEIVPEVVAPPGIRAQVVPSQVLVSVQ